jgi:hypothetical protein
MPHYLLLTTCKEEEKAELEFATRNKWEMTCHIAEYVEGYGHTDFDATEFMDGAVDVSSRTSGVYVLENSYKIDRGHFITLTISDHTKKVAKVRSKPSQPEPSLGVGPALDLTKLTLKEWSTLTHGIFEMTNLDYVFLKETGKKKIFRQRGNMWGGRQTGRQCKAYDTECDFNDRISPTSHIFYQIALLGDTLDEECPEEESKNIWDLLKTATLDTSFACNRPIQFKHCFDEPNTDHRGSDHTKLILDWNRFFVLSPKDGKLTLRDIAEAIFRVKSHKFDSNYEMLLGVSEIKVTPTLITLELGFDYGS